MNLSIMNSSTTNSSLFVVVGVCRRRHRQSIAVNGFWDVAQSLAYTRSRRRRKKPDRANKYCHLFNFKTKNV